MYCINGLGNTDCAAVTSPRLHIRLDVDVDHARRALAARGHDGYEIDPALLTTTVSVLRDRLQRDIAAAYPGARITVAAWPRSPKERPTQVRLGFRVADGPTEARCAMIREHVDSLRSAAIATLLVPQAPDEPGPIASEALPAASERAPAVEGSAGELSL